MHTAAVRTAKLSILLLLLAANAQIQAQSAGPLSATVSISGIEDAAGYAAVTAWLESVVSLQGLAVEEVGGDTVVYRVRTQGDLQQLAGAIGSNAQLQSLPSTDPASLQFRYSP